MPRLSDLGAVFVRCGERLERATEAVGDPLTWRPGDPTVEVERLREFSDHADAAGLPFGLAEAHGVRFRCPGSACNGHVVSVSFAGRGVPDHLGSHDRDGRPSRWSVAGTGLDDLTLTPSVDVGTPSCWHGFVTNGSAA